MPEATCDKMNNQRTEGNGYYFLPGITQGQEDTGVYRMASTEHNNNYIG